VTAGSELLDTICANPSDVDSRLVYSDWLTESDDPRGEFIANHCRLEGMSGLEDEYPFLLASTNRLEANFAPAWFGEYMERTGFEDRNAKHGDGLTRSPMMLNPEFEYGFLKRIAGRLEDISAQWSWLREREPVQGMELLVGEHIPKEFHSLSEPSEWRTLKVSADGWFTANSVGDVLRWGFPKLVELDLYRCSLGVDGCRLLANLETTLPDTFDDWTPPPKLPEGQLTTLALTSCEIGDEGAQVLFAAKTMSALQRLNLNQCRLTESSTLEALRNCSNLLGLEELGLFGNKELGGKLVALAGWDVLPKLRHLALPQTTTEEDFDALFPCASNSLRSLTLSSAKELLKAPARVAAASESFTRLDVGTTRMGDKNWQVLLKAPSMPSLVDLRANGCSLSDKGIAELVASDLDRLVSLDLSSNKLTDKALAELSEWPGLRHVTHLRIGNNRKLSPVGYQSLIASSLFDPARLDIGKSDNADIIGPLQERFTKALVHS
jgi:uncharacterized protein (TIGR02996 family)